MRLFGRLFMGAVLALVGTIAVVSAPDVARYLKMRAM